MRAEEVVQSRRGPKLVEAGGHSSKAHECDEVVGVLTEADEPVRGMEPEELARRVVVASVPLHHRQACSEAAPRSRVHALVPVHEVSGGFAPAGHIDAETKCRREQGRVDAARGPRRGGDLKLVAVGGLDVARQQRAHPPEQGHEPAHEGLAQPLGQARERGDVAVDRGNVAGLKVGDDPKAIPEQLE